MPALTTEDYIERLLTNRHVTPNGCWEWTGRCLPGGYGVVAQKGNSRLPGRITILAHRLAYEVWVGPLSPHEEVRHSCDNPPCFRPMHLDKGTHKQNMDDMAQRGRSTKGRPVGAALAHSLKTHASCGHPFTPDNTYVAPGTGARSCLRCRRERNAAR